VSHGRFDNPVVAALAGFWDLFRKQDNAHRFTENDRADGLTCLVTGANSGLGFAVATELARRGARVIMACRRQIPEAGEKVRMLSGSDRVEMRYLDLSKIETIHEFCEGLKNDGIKLDITVLNAGVALPKARKTASGLEEMFLVNYLANVMLTTLLLNRGIIGLNPGGKTVPRSRVIVISSDSHQGSSYIDYDEFGTYYDYGPSKGISNYSYFKLILNTFATELSRRVNMDGNLRTENGKRPSASIGINVICPGPVHSNIIKEAPFFLRIVLGGIFRIIFRSPARAARPVVYMAISPDYEGRTNEYLHMFNNKRMDPKVYIHEEGGKLWERSFALWHSVDDKAEELKISREKI
jgi:NAD(P)-dependent dehydrogenase (short-subunit alcohol dehydrogenase family)